MKKIGIFVGLFDPITDRHIEDAREFIRTNGLSCLFFQPMPDEGETEQFVRQQLIRKAIRPYRKMVLLEPFPGRIYVDISWVKERDEERELSEKVRNGDFSHLPSSIHRDVIESGIYGKSIVRNMVNEHRYNHSLSVADLSAEIADAHHLDSRKAYLIGLYHDIAKGMSDQQMEVYVRAYDAYEGAYPAGVWHAFVGERLLRRNYGMKDEVMLKAVRHHCLGDDLNPYSKIVYLADKLDTSRGYDSSAEIELAKRDLDSAFRLVHQQQADFLAGKEKK